MGQYRSSELLDTRVMWILLTPLDHLQAYPINFRITNASHPHLFGLHDRVR
jgi:hypothetical protein